MKLKGFWVDQCKKAGFPNWQNEISEENRETHLLIVALDPEIPMTLESATFHFLNREEGLKTFNVLATIARNVHKTCVEDIQLIQR